ncbi:MAG: ATP-dependent DNA helicase RecG, partial [Clostridia bacterium]|nr:ATP-dependent DNA helicase RecG [Clostridia bacterium]
EMHFPSSALKLAKAKETLAFEELLIFQLAMRMLKKNASSSSANKMSYKGRSISKFFDVLPFSLTSAQQRVIKEILDDLCKECAMTRIVIGDVGSGKTVIAAAAMYFTVMQKKGYQCAFMAPTEILANQHYATITKLFSLFGFHIELLTGSMTAKEKSRIKKSLKEGETDIVIGTHALIQSDVAFKDLTLMITDEQHRFGVAQRSGLADKGKSVHTLVMSATPIPRTLSLVLYGDMDVSIIDELPPGRQKVDTFVINNDIRDRAYQFVRKQIQAGFQAYIICPLVEENETLSRKAAETVFKALSEEIFPDIKCGLIHGRLNAKAKDEVMRLFKEGDIRILVSTTVIEVGVDVPNANIILIENAECFGLSQLHQLRGRIGRGNQKSYCILVLGEDNKKAETRMEVFKKENDGFKIAAEDLSLRGPGDFFGLRQSGKLEFKAASLADIALIEKTKEVCETAMEKLDTKEFAPLKKALKAFFENMISKNMVN